MKQTTMAAFFAAAALFSLSNAARAQEASAADSKGPGYREAHDANGSSVIFTDDLNTASGLAPSGDTLKVRGAAARFLLVRPRTNFVQELRKSVENL